MLFDDELIDNGLFDDKLFVEVASDEEDINEGDSKGVEDTFPCSCCFLLDVGDAIGEKSGEDDNEMLSCCCCSLIGEDKERSCCLVDAEVSSRREFDDDGKSPASY